MSESYDAAAAATVSNFQPFLPSYVASLLFCCIDCSTYGSMQEIHGPCQKQETKRSLRMPQDDRIHESNIRNDINFIRIRNFSVHSFLDFGHTA